MTDSSPRAESDDSRIEAALRRYIEQRDRGESVDVEEFIAQHAEIADELRELIVTEQKLQRLADDVPRLGRVNDAGQPVAVDLQATLVPQQQLKPPLPEGDKRLSDKFGRYRIVRPLGEGAMGKVYLAEDTQLRRLVAIKTPQFGHEPTPELLERFYREARAAATLRHPNICPVYDVGQIDGTHYFSMAYIEGRPLSAFTDSSNRQAERQILILVRKLAQALEEAHEHKIVHRDLKPANIIVDKRGEPLIMDFGLARQASRDDEARLTHTGTLVGTPAYMSPEQVDADPDKIGPLADEYSLGVIFYELLTGQLPFRGSTAAVLGQIVTKAPSPPSQARPGMDSRTEAVCLKMMAKNPSDRFPTLATVADELATILRSPAKATTQQSAGFIASAASDGTTPKPPTRKTTFTQEELIALEELGRKCLARHDYDQVVQIVEQLPEAVRTAPLQSLLETSQGKADEVAFLLCEIDEAVRLKDHPSALAKAQKLLTLKPGHRRALEILRTSSDLGPGGAPRLIGSKTFDRPWRGGGWVPWGALAFGLAVFAALSGVIVVYLNRTVVTIDVEDPSLSVAIKGASHAVEGPKREKFAVDPGETEVTVTRDGAVVATRRFSIAKGRQRTVVASLVGSKVVVELDHEPLLAANDRDKEIPAKGNANAKPKPLAQAQPGAGQQLIANKGRSPDSKALVKFEIRDPQLKALMPGSFRSLAAPGEEVTVEPGQKVLTIGYGALSFKTKEFTLKSGRNAAIRLSKVDSTIIAKLGDSELGRWAVKSPLPPPVEKAAVRLPGEKNPKPRRLTGGAVTKFACFDREQNQDANIWGMQFSPDSRLLLAAGSDTGPSGAVYLWDVAAGKQSRVLLPGEEAWFATSVFSPASDLVVSCYERDTRVFVWDLATGKPRYLLSGHTKPATNPAISPDGKLLVAGSKDNSLIVWRLETGQALCRFALGLERGAGKFSPDNKSVLAYGRDRNMRLFDAQTGALVRVFAGHSLLCFGGTFSLDGRQLLSYGGDKTVRLWDATTGKQIRQFEGCKDTIRDAAFLPDETQVFAWGKDRNFRVWETATSRQIRAIDLGKDWRADPGRLALSPDSLRILSIHADNTLRLRDIETGDTLYTFSNVPDCYGLTFSPDGRFAAAGSFRHGVYLFRLPTEAAEH